MFRVNPFPENVFDDLDYVSLDNDLHFGGLPEELFPVDQIGMHASQEDSFLQFVDLPPFEPGSQSGLLLESANSGYFQFFKPVYEKDIDAFVIYLGNGDIKAAGQMVINTPELLFEKIEIGITQAGKYIGDYNCTPLQIAFIARFAALSQDEYNKYNELVNTLLSCFIKIKREDDLKMQLNELQHGIFNSFYRSCKDPGPDFSNEYSFKGNHRK